VGKALITGGAGFIGSHLCELLLEEAGPSGSRRPLDRFARQRRGAWRRPGFPAVVDSVLNRAIVNELVLNAMSSTTSLLRSSWAIVNSGAYPRDELEGTEVVRPLQSFWQARPHCFPEVYGDHRDEKPLEETSRRVWGRRRGGAGPMPTRRPWTSSSRSRTTRRIGLDCTIARLFNTVGPRQWTSTGWSCRGSSSALLGEPLEIFGDGAQTRCFCHVSDTIRAQYGLMEHDDAGEIYNVGSTEQISIVDLAQKVIDATGSASTMTFVPFEEAYGHGIEDMLHRIPSTEKIRAATGWQPTKDLDAVLADVVAFLASGSAAR
jgi:UDP-glucose 4-epimerase